MRNWKLIDGQHIYSIDQVGGFLVANLANFFDQCYVDLCFCLQT